MRHETALRHEFVEFIPDELKAGTVYVSIRFATASHLCCCGCGNKVVTPLRPTDWRLIFDGKTVSLEPSIGNWSFDCRSHYWIVRDTVRWARHWSPDEVAAGRMYDAAAKEKYFGAGKAPEGCAPAAGGVASGAPGGATPREGRWQRLKKWFGFGGR
jgi:hypothetical protein